MNYHPLPSQRSVVASWLEAGKLLRDTGPQFGVVLHATNPLEFSEREEQVIVAVDRFLRTRGTFPISTVSNTIFPAALWNGGPADELYTQYLKVYPKAKKSVPDWGRYFHRMIAWPTVGKSGRINQIDQVIQNLRKYGPESGRFVTNMYEVTLFDPSKDAGKYRNRQCLSFLEFKPERSNGADRLHLTAMYRSHFYVAKTLGNLIGLGDLLRFVAHQVALEPGSLTVHSSYAELDTSGNDPDRGRSGWTLSEARELITRCDAIIRADEEATQLISA